MSSKLREFVHANWTISEKALLITDVLLAGILIGWLTSPLKNGLRLFSGNSFGSNNAGCGPCEAPAANENEIQEEE